MQEARQWALEAVDKCEPGRDLSNFLFVHVKNRLRNLKRNKHYRAELPCHTCPFWRPKEEHDCAGYADKMECDRWALHFRRNTAKKSLSDKGRVELDEKRFPQEAMNVDEEMIEYVSNNIPAHFRSDWLKFLSNMGSKRGDFVIVKSRRIKDLITEVKRLLTQYGEENRPAE